MLIVSPHRKPLQYSFPSLWNITIVNIWECILLVLHTHTKMKSCYMCAPFFLIKILFHDSSDRSDSNIHIKFLYVDITYLTNLILTDSWVVNVSLLNINKYVFL